MSAEIKALNKRLDSLEKMLRSMDIEKRLKFAEDRIKVLTDSLTTSKDVEKILDVYYKRMGNDPQFANKVTMRELELTTKRQDLRDKEIDKEMRLRDKEYEKMNKDMMTQAEAARLESRLQKLESMVAAALTK